MSEQLHYYQQPGAQRYHVHGTCPDCDCDIAVTVSVTVPTEEEAQQQAYIVCPGLDVQEIEEA